MPELLVSHPALAIAAIVALGAGAQWFAWRVGLPAILPLLVVGFVAGPLFGWLDPSVLIGDDLLFPAVSLAVGLILFEGGLTLSLPEVRETRGVVIRLVTVGALVTWLGATLAAWSLVGLSAPVAFLFGALVIVTGPTVIGPLLRIVRPSARIGNVLKWEGILVDAIGAMVAVLVFEFLLIENREMALGQTVLLFVRFILTGTVVGAVAGFALAYLLRRRILPDYLVNLVALAFVFAAFAVAGALAPEAGLLATVLMGMVISNLKVPNIQDLLSFKEDLTVLFISLLFIVLAANVNLDAFMAALSLSSLALLAVIILAIRPLAVFASTLGSSLSWREKLFLGWIAPRGIVAAAVSSLFASKLVAAGFEGAESLVPLVFLVIVGTVLLGSLTAKPVAEALGVAEPDPQGFLILGAHPIARRIAAFLKEQDLGVMLADTNWSNVAAARLEGLPAYYGSLLSDRSDDEIRLSGLGRLLALTSNDEANALSALKYARSFGSQNVYQLAPGRAGTERDGLSTEQRGRVAFGRDVDYDRLERLFDRGAVLTRTELSERADLGEVRRRADASQVPLFLLQNGSVKVLTEEGPVPEAGATLVSLVAPDEADAADSAG
jgi:NhaP-type Na+/H+ or K+/H+ antiporter